MCSIFGLVTGGGPTPDGVADKYLKSLWHRGPDDHGLFNKDGVLIGMNRLSIIDLETGHQPIPNEDGSMQICFNGEIYNYRELRSDLKSRGHRFRTASDTEVILHAFEEYGYTCLDKFNGMFAFVIANLKTGEVFLARDRLGIKPLYYVYENGNLYFGSELKSILSVVGGSGPVDRLALSRYFSFGYVPSPQTPFERIKKLQSGHYMTLKKGVVDVRAYWNASFKNSELPNAGDIRDEIRGTHDNLEKAVGMELMSDVPLGCFLSGGVDSSAIVAMAQRAKGEPIHSYCYKFDESTHDESADAKIVADHIGSIHHEVSITQSDILGALDSITDSLDEPFADSTYLTLLLLSREVRKDVKVVLTGMGGDEIFTGYPTIRAHRYQTMFRRIPGLLREGLLPPIVNSLPVSDKYFSFEFKAKRFIRGQGFPQEIQHFIWMQNFSHEEKRKLLGDFVPENDVMDTYANVQDELKRCDASDLMNRILYLDMKFFLENNGLFQVDRASMAHSLEARVPLLNNVIMDELLGVPFSHKYHAGQTKYLLRESVRKILPERVFTKPKKGFGPPVSAWLRTIMKDFMLDTLSEKRLLASTPLDYNFISKLISEHLQRKADHGRSLWAILIFALWWNKYA